MKEKTTIKFDAINKDAIVGGGRSRTFRIDIPGPPGSALIKKIASIKPSIKRVTKKRKCSGCSRKRKRG